jgi:hypothetical protein
VGLASLGPLVPVGAPAPASMAVAATLAVPAASAAAGQEPGEERVELRQALLGNLDCHRLYFVGVGSEMPSISLLLCLLTLQA